MSKLDNITPNKQQTVKPVEQPKQLENTHKAFAVYRDKADQKFVLVEVSYNPEASNVKKLARDVREDIIDKLKMAIADNFFGDDL